jgi:hypothetical protein
MLPPKQIRYPHREPHPEKSSHEPKHDLVKQYSIKLTLTFGEDAEARRDKRKQSDDSDRHDDTEEVSIKWFLGLFVKN